METGTWKVKVGLAQMLKGGVIMDVVTPEQAKIAQDAGACAVMALERVPADIRKAGGVARMADPTIIENIMKAVSIPVMAKCRIGHSWKAQVLEASAWTYRRIRSAHSAMKANHVGSTVLSPFVCACRNLGEALPDICEGASLYAPKGSSTEYSGSSQHMRTVQEEIRKLATLRKTSFWQLPKRWALPLNW
jgi:pyridoxal 5'-phosphate synthase pdxS subunit